MILSAEGRVRLNAIYDELCRVSFVDQRYQVAANSRLLAVESALRDDARVRGVHWPEAVTIQETSSRDRR